MSGPPKRFAQGVGAVVHHASPLVAWLAGSTVVPAVALAIMVVFATLESVFAFCAGCQVFGLLMRAGRGPGAVCAECADLWSRVRVP